MSARSKARKRALDVLYSADLRSLDLGEALGIEAERAVAEPDRTASWVYAEQIVQGVIDHAIEIDETIVSYARGWTLQRMPAVDRALLRIGVWELLHNPEVPEGVVIAETVKLAAELSTDDSAGFLNGVLSRVAPLRKG